jgi:hypothetical protein
MALGVYPSEYLLNNQAVTQLYQVSKPLPQPYTRPTLDFQYLDVGSYLKKIKIEHPELGNSNKQKSKPST